MADIWVPLRAGSDILFLGGLIHLRSPTQPGISRLRSGVHERVYLLRDDFRDTEELDGLFLRVGCGEKK